VYNVAIPTVTCALEPLEAGPELPPEPWSEVLLAGAAQHHDEVGLDQHAGYLLASCNGAGQLGEGSGAEASACSLFWLVLLAS
jgi:hypothetical protein